MEGNIENQEATAGASAGAGQNDTTNVENQTTPNTKADVKDDEVLSDPPKQQEQIDQGDAKSQGNQKQIDPEDLEPSDGVYKFFDEDGKEVAAEDAAGFQDLFKEAHLTSRQAKILKQGYDKAMLDVREQINGIVKTNSDKWLAEVKADRELGGENLTATKMNIGRAIDAYGSPELRQYLKDTRLGNNPAMVRFLNAVGKQVSPDKFVNGNGASRIETSYETAKRLYPNSPDMWGHK